MPDNRSQPASTQRRRLVTAVAVFASCVWLPVGLAQESQGEAADPEPGRFSKDIDAFAQWDARNSPAEDAVLFVGSSSIVFWETHRAFPDLPVINRGFGGSHISDVNHYFDQVVTPYHARAIVLYAGDNDVADHKSPRQVFDDYRDFLGKVRKIDADVPVLYVAIKPSRARWSLWPQMMAANELIEGAAERDPKLTYVDIATPMIGDDGEPRKELFAEDGLHLNAEGYKVWNATLRPILDEALASK